MDENARLAGLARKTPDVLVPSLDEVPQAACIDPQIERNSVFGILRIGVVEGDNSIFDIELRFERPQFVNKKRLVIGLLLQGWVRLPREIELNHKNCFWPLAMWQVMKMPSVSARRNKFS